MTLTTLFFSALKPVSQIGPYLPLKVFKTYLGRNGSYAICAFCVRQRLSATLRV